MRSRGSRPSRARLRVGIDTGGTFTDFHVTGGSFDRIFKIPSTPHDPSSALLEGLRRIRSWSSQGGGGTHRMAALTIVHGTTVGTNALLTRRLARTAFVTTAGFEDLIEIGRQARASLYDLLAAPPVPLVPRALRFGVNERVHLAAAGPQRGHGGDGEGPVRGRARVTRRAPDPREIEALRRRLVRLGVESVAVGFLHAYLDPANERRVGRALQSRGVPVTLSHHVSNEYREYERFSTTIANAALRPVAGRYLDLLHRGARGANLAILQSDGTTATPRAASRDPVRTVLSGPAGGALAAAALARRLGDRRVLSFDMGGTSTDAVLIDGDLPRVVQGAISGLPLRSPMIEVHTVGAGGGSIARRDAAGGLRVGPQSAGADPGPACYGSGTEPTVTDAHLVLGRLGPEGLLGGTIALDRARARTAVGRLARALGMTVETAAEGILEVVEATMERALRLISMERGKDPRGGALYAFGGAGALHACALAERLGMHRVVVPGAAGVFSATGLSAAAPGVEVSRTVFALASESGRLLKALRSLTTRAESRLRAQGVRGAARVAWFADLRYAGQSHEITVPFGVRMTAAFRRAHEERYGHLREGAQIEVVTLRVRASKPLAPRPPAQVIPVDESGRAAGLGGRGEQGGPRAPARERVHVRGRWARCPVVPSEVLRKGRVLAGPTLVTEYSTTTFVAPGWQVRAGPSGVLVLSRRKGSHVSRSLASGPAIDVPTRRSTARRASRGRRRG